MRLGWMVVVIMGCGPVVASSDAGDGAPASSDAGESTSATGGGDDVAGSSDEGGGAASPCSSWSAARESFAGGVLPRIDGGAFVIGADGKQPAIFLVDRDGV